MWLGTEQDHHRSQRDMPKTKLTMPPTVAATGRTTLGKRDLLDDLLARRHTGHRVGDAGENHFQGRTAQKTKRGYAGCVDAG